MAQTETPTALAVRKGKSKASLANCWRLMPWRMASEVAAGTQEN